MAESKPDPVQEKPFSLLIKPASADCNLRCRYCFYLDRADLYPETRRHRMSDAVLERMIRSYMGTEQPQYAFGWQGGEPALMGLDFFKRVVDLQQASGRAGAVVSNGLQTNGTLLDDAFARHLAEYRFLVGVSVDGPPAVHDHYRTYVDDRGAHRDVMRGIEALKRHGVDFNILTLVSQSNVKKPREIYHYLCDHGFLFQQYIECVEFDAAGNRMPYAISGEEWGEFLCAIFDEWYPSDTRRVSVRLFDSILTLMVDGVANTCSMGRDCRQYFVVEWNGDIYPCDFFVEAERRLGNVMETDWAALQTCDAYRAFGARKLAWNDACRNCEFSRFCAGDCPKNRPGQGNRPGSLSALCRGWKMFYRHALPSFEKLAGDIRAERRQAAPSSLFNPADPAQPQAARVGRNAPCPCGSGRKFKKCCGR